MSNWYSNKETADESNKNHIDAYDNEFNNKSGDYYDEEFAKEAEKEKRAIDKIAEMTGLSFSCWDTKNQVFHIDIGADSWELKKQKYKATACLRKFIELTKENGSKVPDITPDVEVKLQEAIDTARYHMGFPE